MTGEVEAHETSTSMVKAALAEVDAGTDIVLKVKVSCSSNCNLEGGKVRIVDDEGAVVKDVELLSLDGIGNDTDEFVVKAPNKPGGYTWTVVFLAQENEGVLHQESSAPFSFTVKRHSTSIAVWHVPSPIAFDTKFKLKVGVKCSADCRLTDREVEIYDHEAAKVATGTLVGAPWPGTSALYWAEMGLEAPGVEGYYRWRVKFPKPDLEVPHEEASCEFGFTTASPPEHVVTVEVTEKRTKAAIKGAYVVLQPYTGYPYRGNTGEGGVARLSVPSGEYKLHVSMNDYEYFETTAGVAGDAKLKAELIFRPAGP